MDNGCRLQADSGTAEWTLAPRPGPSRTGTRPDWRQSPEISHLRRRWGRPSPRRTRPRRSIMLASPHTILTVPRKVAAVPPARLPHQDHAAYLDRQADNLLAHGR